MTDTVRVVDLFCGCGGLSLGFELYSGSVRYQTVMALDNDSAPLNCYNTNFKNSHGSVATGRLCDLTWFNHPSEVLLYYLVHVALWQPDASLLAALKASPIQLQTFLTSLKHIDEEHAAGMAKLASESLYRKAVISIDHEIFKMAIGKSFLGKIGILSFSGGLQIPTSEPWQDEYSLLQGAGDEEGPLADQPIVTEIEISLQNQWDAEVSKLDESSRKEGRGQHKVVAKRLQTLVQFLKGEAGRQLGHLWVEWRARRDSLRARYCMRVQRQLRELYEDNRQVQLVLGGPPCKGFSRIGRAVIESLRDQGVHAWISEEYGDERNALLHKYVLFLDALRPNAFIFENVAHFTSGLRTPAGRLDAAAILAQSIQDLSANHLHYDVKARVMKARQHAIPQDRERYIMIGINAAVSGPSALKEAFALRSYDRDVPLDLALRGLDAPGIFSFVDRTSCRTDHLSKAYTLVDSNMPAPHVRYVQWIRQPAHGRSEAPPYTDAHIVRLSRPDDLALITKFAPGQRWMDYKLKSSRTVADLQSLLSRLLDYMRRHPDQDLIVEDEVKDLLGRVDEGLLLRLILEEASPKEADLTPRLVGGAKLDREHHLLSHTYLAKGDDRHGDWFERLSADRPCKTIVAHIGKDTYGYIHPYANRPLSMREAARVQSFPDYFSFAGTGVVEGYAMIGNAVPPLLATAFAERLAILHDKIGLFGVNDAGSSTISQPQQLRQLALNVL